MKLFTKAELTFIVLVLALLFGVSWWNLQVSYARARDATRRDDVSQIVNILEDYNYGYGSYPPADKVTGKLKVCGTDSENPQDCPWGSRLEDFGALPKDPHPDREFFYQVSSDSSKFKVWAAMDLSESASEGVNPQTAPLCGKARCNYVQASVGLGPEDKL